MRPLALQVRFRIVEGRLTLDGKPVGEVTGQAVFPVNASFRAIQPPGQYQYMPSDFGAPADSMLVETMGYLDTDGVVNQASLPDIWGYVPEEALEEVHLDAVLDFEAVEADDEYRLNEPQDLEDLKAKYSGRWKISVRFPLGMGFPRDQSQLNLDRRDFEVDTKHTAFTRDTSQTKDPG